jgi:hypothetical protein
MQKEKESSREADKLKIFRLKRTPFFTSRIFLRHSGICALNKSWIEFKRESFDIRHRFHNLPKSSVTVKNVCFVALCQVVFAASE